MKLHIGCGKRVFPRDWYNIDGCKLPHIDDHDVWVKTIDDNSVNIIYSSHLLEYFDKDEAVELLGEWYRVLKRGGTLRIAVPDFDSMVLAVAHYGFELKHILGPLFGKMELNGEKIFHKTVYNFTMLREVLKVVGFKNVHRYNWRQTEHAQFDDHSQAYLPHMQKEKGLLISLNVEATK